MTPAERARAVIRLDRAEAALDATAAHAVRVLALYRTSFPSSFGPCAGRRAGERPADSTAEA